MFNLDKANMHHLLALPWNLCMTLTCYSSVKLQKNPAEKVKQERSWTRTDWWRFSLLFNFLLCSDVPDTWSPMHAGGGGDHWPLVTKQSTWCYRRPGVIPSWRRLSPSPWTWASPRTAAGPPWPTSPCCPSCSRSGSLSPTPGSNRVSDDWCH